METKPNSFLVGIVTLAILIAGTLFVVWFSKADFGTKQNLYRIDFAGSVTGLRENEDVLYQGIPIGKVRKIGVYKSNVNRIKVTVDINRPDLIRESSIATIEAQGLTGYTFVQIKGSEQDSPLLKISKGEKMPIIHSKRSSLETLFSKAPELLEKLTAVAVQLNKFFDDRMIKESRITFQNLKTLTKDLAEGPNSLKNVLSEFKNTSKSMRHLIEYNKESIALFFETGLPALTQMTGKVGGAADQVSDMMKMVRQSPLSTLSASHNQGYKVDG